MASMYGVSIKDLKSWNGPAGIMWAGRLCLNDVIIGIWSYDNYDRPDRFELLPEFDLTKFSFELKKRVNNECLPEDIFMGRLLDLTFEEKIFLTGRTAGGVLVSISNGCNVEHFPLPDK